jgi:hypothetical protein
VKRRTKWIVGLAIGVPLALVGAVAIVLLFMNEDPADVTSSVAVKDLPSTLSPETSPSLDTSLPPTDSETAPESFQPPSIASLGFPMTGTLIMEGDGESFGEETYALTLEEDSVVLSASGKFWFKVLIATITIGFDQTLLLDTSLRPQSLDVAFDGPLRFDREIHAEVAANSVTIRTGDEIRTLDLRTENIFVISTFSTYALIPLLFELRGIEGRVGFETLLLGGPPNQENTDDADGLPIMSVERTTDGIIRYQGRDIGVSRYVISGGTGAMMLFALGTEFLGVYAEDDDEGALLIYRADYFEGGFEVPVPTDE